MTYRQIIEMREPTFLTHSRFDLFVTYATEKTIASVFGDDYQNAIALRVMHMITLSNNAAQNSGSGQIVSMSEGEMSITYAQQSGNTGPLSGTQYGRELQELIDLCGVGFGNRMAYES